MSAQLEFIDAQHFLLAFHEMVGMMADDRPGDNDPIFAWVTFNSCVKLLNILGAVDGNMLKLILKIKRPTNDDEDDQEKYLRKMYDISEKMLNLVGWPQDISVEE